MQRPTAGGDGGDCEVEAAGASKLRRLVREAMVGAWPGLRVPLEVTTKQGLSWGELEDVMD